MPRLTFSCRLVLLLTLAGGCHNAAPPVVGEKGRQPDTARLARIDASLAAASRFLASQQSADGGWRSKPTGP